jgi:hypothetical protein
MTAESLRGFWTTLGYGWQLEFTGDDRLIVHETTSLSCLPSWEANLVRREPRLAVFQMTQDPVTIEISPSRVADRIRVQPVGMTVPIWGRRLPGQQAVCEHASPDTPRSNFDVFSETWAENYPFFGLRKVDWANVVRTHRAKVTDRTSPAELFAILESMIAPMEDAHSFLSGPDGSNLKFRGFQRRPGALDPHLFGRAEKIADGYLTGTPRRFWNGRITYGMLRGDVGYMRIGTFSQLPRDGSFERGLAALDDALDAVFADAGRWRALVIDMRINGGGLDRYGHAVAARLTASAYVAYTVQAREGAGDSTAWTPGDDAVVSPSPRHGFRGPVFELTGPNTISAAETFTQALLGRTPPVVRIGQNTQGVFSLVLERSLPNGWGFGVPNQRFLTGGKSYDGAGIPPTVTVPLFGEPDLAAKRDLAIETALRLASDNLHLGSVAASAFLPSVAP